MGDLAETRMVGERVPVPQFCLRSATTRFSSILIGDTEASWRQSEETLAQCWVFLGRKEQTRFQTQGEVSFTQP